MNKNDKIYVAGHTGIIGSAIFRRLVDAGYANLITRTHNELDLTDQYQVKDFFEKEKPDYVFFAASKGGGIYTNKTYRAELIYENIIMQSNVIHHSFLNEVKKMISFACADIYPKSSGKPAKEEFLLTGSLDNTCEPFALSKIAGIKMCEAYNSQFGTDFIVVVPPNVYGPNQHYDIMNTQVLPALMQKFHEAKVRHAEEVIIWGTGLPVRDFLFVDDVVDACMFLMEKYTGSEVFFNIGTGKRYTILELAELMKNIIGYEGKIIFDTTKPDGLIEKLLDVSKINSIGWKFNTDLVKGLEITYKAFLDEIKNKEVRTSHIRHIKSCEKDRFILNNINSNIISANPQPETYKNKVVLKPWGHEFLVFENTLVAVWLLYIKKGYSTSMHCHPLKNTSLILLSGNAMTNTFLHRTHLSGGDAIIIEKGVFHSTKALSDDGIYLLEIEKPSNKTDLVRLQDGYGRERSGYEGLAEMEIEDLQSFDYFYFEETDYYEKYTYNGEKFSVTFEVFIDNDEFQKNFKIKLGELYTSCRGKLYDDDNKPLLELGETKKANIKGMKIFEKTVLLTTGTKGK